MNSHKVAGPLETTGCQWCIGCPQEAEMGLGPWVSVKLQCKVHHRVRPHGL